MRNFDEWFGQFRESIATYDYYTNFENVYSNAEKLKVELNIINSLIGSKEIKKEFKKLLELYPNCLKAIPILLAKRETEIICVDKEKGARKYNFSRRNYTIEDYSYFMEKTGLYDLLEKHIISNVYDYVLGVNTGLDSNGRKNRGGHLMENLCEEYIRKHTKESGLEYGKEVCLSKLESKTNLDLSQLSNDGKAEKRFDFVIYGKDATYAIECNFYASSGSKLNETARSYKTLALESKNISKFKVVWITDGIGWKDAKNNLEETFDVLPTMYNISDLENGIIKTLI